MPNVGEAFPVVRDQYGNQTNAFNLGSTSSALFSIEGGLYGVFAHGSWGTYATSTLTMVNLPAAGDTVTVGGHAYRFELVGNLAQAYDVTLPASGTTAAKIAAALANLAAVIAGIAATNSQGYTSTANSEVTATATATTLTATAQTVGTGGNSYAVSTTTSGNTWSPATDMAGGAAGTITLQGLGPDGVTLITVLAAFTADTYQTVYLPPGQYQFTVASSTVNYANLVRIPT